MFDHLPEEGDDPLGSVLVHVRQVNLVAEHHQPYTQLNTGGLGIMSDTSSSEQLSN